MFFSLSFWLTLADISIHKISNAKCVDRWSINILLVRAQIEGKNIIIVQLGTSTPGTNYKPQVLIRFHILFFCQYLIINVITKPTKKSSSCVCVNEGKNHKLLTVGWLLNSFPFNQKAKYKRVMIEILSGSHGRQKKEPNWLKCCYLVWNRKVIDMFLILYWECTCNLGILLCCCEVDDWFNMLGSGCTCRHPFCGCMVWLTEQYYLKLDKQVSISLNKLA